MNAYGALNALGWMLITFSAFPALIGIAHYLDKRSREAYFWIFAFGIVGGMIIGGVLALMMARIIIFTC